MRNVLKQIIPVILILLINISGECSVSKNLNINYSDTVSIKVHKAYKLIKEKATDPQFVILDVRKSDDFKKDHIANAINVDFKSDDFLTRLDGLDKNKIYLIYCYAGFRSRNTMKIMEKKGFTKIYNMKGGMIKWRAKKLPVVTD